MGSGAGGERFGTGGKGLMQVVRLMVSYGDINPAILHKSYFFACSWNSSRLLGKELKAHYRMGGLHELTGPQRIGLDRDAIQDSVA